MTKHVMIALVSDQPLPNIMAALQSDPPPDHIEFIISADKDKEGEYDGWYERKYHALARALQHLNIQSDRVAPAHPYQMENVKQRCLDAIAKHRNADQITINITGGTKLMALAAFAAGQSAGYPVIYIESRDRQLIRIVGETSSAQPFVESRFNGIDVQTYLEAYGRRILAQTNHQDLADDKVTIAQIFVNHLTTARPLLQRILSAVRHYGDPKAPRNFRLDRVTGDQQKLIDQLLASAFLQYNPTENLFSIPTEEIWHFIQGDWLEIYAFDRLWSSQQFHDVRSNVRLTGADTELDIVLTCNASLAICEAKIGSKLSVTMSRLRALKETLAGVYGRTFYLTASERVSREMRLAARDFGITEIICGSELPDIVGKIWGQM